MRAAQLGVTKEKSIAFFLAKKILLEFSLETIDVHSFAVS